MRSGAETLDGIEEALRDLKAQEASLQHDLESAARQRADLASQRLEALKALAAARARDAMADGAITQADNISDQMRGALEARLKTIGQLTERQSLAERTRAAIVESEDVLQKDTAALESELDRFGAQAREELGDTLAYKTASETHQALVGMLEKARAKAEQVARDEQEKGQPYRGDPLFMYLWQRQFATSGYKASGLVRTLDTWVADLIRFAEARANYSMLTEIPVRLRAHAEDLGRQAAAAKAQLDGLVSEKTQALAGSDLIGRLKAARQAQADLHKELETVTSELAETGSQLALYAKGEDASFKSAVQTYASLLEREPLRGLIVAAGETATPDDDRVVAEVRRLGGEMEELERGNTTRRRRLEQISERRMELARLATDFRRQRYDDVASEFNDNPRIEDLLQLLLRGAITAAEYWARVQAQQRWRHRPADPWRQQSGLPPFDGFPGGWGGGGGGGWGSGSSSGGGSGSSGDDFETGGTF